MNINELTPLEAGHEAGHNLGIKGHKPWAYDAGTVIEFEEVEAGGRPVPAESQAGAPDRLRTYRMTFVQEYVRPAWNFSRPLLGRVTMTAIVVLPLLAVFAGVCFILVSLYAWIAPQVEQILAGLWYAAVGLTSIVLVLALGYLVYLFHAQQRRETRRQVYRNRSSDNRNGLSSDWNSSDPDGTTVQHIGNGSGIQVTINQQNNH